MDRSFEEGTEALMERWRGRGREDGRDKGNARETMMDGSNDEWING